MCLSIRPLGSWVAMRWNRGLADSVEPKRARASAEAAVSTRWPWERGRVAGGPWRISREGGKARSIVDRRDVAQCSQPQSYVFLDHERPKPSG